MQRARVAVSFFNPNLYAKLSTLVASLCLHMCWKCYGSSIWFLAIVIHIMVDLTPLGYREVVGQRKTMEDVIPGLREKAMSVFFLPTKTNSTDTSKAQVQRGNLRVDCGPTSREAVWISISSHNYITSLASNIVSYPNHALNLQSCRERKVSVYIQYKQKLPSLFPSVWPSWSWWRTTLNYSANTQLLLWAFVKNECIL